MVWAGVGRVHVWFETKIFDGALCIVCHIHSVFQSFRHILSGFPPWSNMLSRTTIAPCAVKIPGLWKVKGKSNQYVNRGSVNHTFPGQLCQDQLYIHHSLHDLRVQLKKEIKDGTEEREKRGRHVAVCIWSVKWEERSDRPSEVWHLYGPISYHVNTSQTAHPGCLICPSSPSRCSPNEGVKGWQVPGGTARSLRAQISLRLHSRSPWVEQMGLEVGDGQSPEEEEDGTSEKPSHLINFIYGQMTKSHSCLRQAQSAFRVLPTSHCKSIILESSTFCILVMVTAASPNVQCISVIQKHQNWSKSVK